MPSQDQFKKSLEFRSAIVYTNIFTSAKQWHLLYEHDTGRVLCASPWHATILTMQDMTLNAIPLWWMNSNVSKLTREFNITTPWQCFWNPNTQTFSIDTQDLDHDALYRYNLLAEKAAILDTVNQKIYNHRRFLWNDQMLQPTVYHMKYVSACDVLRDPEPEKDPQRWPLVYDYAEFAGKTMAEAAEEIVFQYRLWETRISNTETLRLRTNRAIAQCQDIDKLTEISQNFIAESDLYGKM